MAPSVTNPSNPATNPNALSAPHTVEPSRPTLSASPFQPVSDNMPQAQPQFSFAKSKIKVLVLENIHQSALDIFTAETFNLVSIPRALSEQELIESIQGVHLLCIRSKTKVTKAVLEAADRLLAIGCFCIGTDQVDLKAAEISGVPVFNAPFSNTRSVAELVLAEIIALSRKICDKSQAAHDGVWDKSASGCVEVRGKTLGIVGYGHIGSQLSILAEALGMNVVYHDVVSVLPIGNGKAVSTLNDLLRTADVVSLHVPKSPSTNKLIGANELALMKKGAFLINASRGTVVDIDALAKSVRSGHIGGTAIDVFPSEPAQNGPGFETPLRGLPNVILTPHIGGSTSEAQRNIGVEVAAALVKFVNQGSSIGSVNFPNLDIPHTPHCHRILNMHKNVPGVLSAVNGILCNNKCNVKSQLLGTSTEIGYLIIDIDKETSLDTKAAISDLDTSIGTRILY